MMFDLDRDFTEEGDVRYASLVSKGAAFVDRAIADFVARDGQSSDTLGIVRPGWRSWRLAQRRAVGVASLVLGLLAICVMANIAGWFCIYQVAYTELSPVARSVSDWLVGLSIATIAASFLTGGWAAIRAERILYFGFDDRLSGPSIEALASTAWALGDTALLTIKRGAAGAGTLVPYESIGSVVVDMTARKWMTLALRREDGTVIAEFADPASSEGGTVAALASDIETRIAAARGSIDHATPAADRLTSNEKETK
jgi:hypothetical protein